MINFEGEALCYNTNKPVSYTHLDVYKRQVHNQVEEFKVMPNNKKMKQPKTQIKKEIVKDVEVKQQKKMPELEQEEIKDVLRILMERYKQIHKQMDDFDKKRDDDQKIESDKKIEVKEDQSVSLPENNNNETNDEYMEMKTEKRHHRKLIKTMVTLCTVSLMVVW